MLAALGAESVEDLLVHVPRILRLDGLDLPAGLSEMETMAEVRRLAGLNRAYEDRFCFRGAGVYRRFIPSAVGAVLSKPEFYTAYPPYQPEASQGTLQAIFEFQTMIAELTGLDVANASLYDGATAVGEAAMMAHTHTGRDEVLVHGYLHPEYMEVLRAFSEGRGIKVRKGGEPGAKTAAVIFQQPDFLGLLVDARGLDSTSLPRPPAGVAALVSCSPGGQAGDRPDARHGRFFYAVIGALRGSAGEHPAPAPVGVADPVLVLEARRLAGEVRIERGLQRLAVLGVDALEPGAGTVQGFDRADHLAEPLREPESLRVQVPIEGRVACAVQRQRRTIRLRLGEEHRFGRHAILAARNEAKVHVHAQGRARGHL